MGKQYEPTWQSLQNHRTPQWLRESKFGIYTHWGIYSVPACGPNGTWYPYNMYRPGNSQHDHHEKDLRRRVGVRIQGFHPPVHCGEVRCRRVGGAVQVGRGQVRGAGRRTPRRVLPMGQHRERVECGENGSEAGRGRRTGKGDPGPGDALHDRLPPLRAVVVLSALAE